ncbi:MAG: HAMP domain-containing sensor histidine kinase [Balneolaceae bacterium]
MKLFTRFITIYLVITVIALVIGGIVSYSVIKDEIETELKWQFLERIDRVTYLLEKGRRFNRVKKIDGDRNLAIRQLDRYEESRVEIGDTMVWHDYLEQMEANLKVTAYRNIDGTSYYISTHGAIIESDDITEAVIESLLWIFGIQVAGAIGVGFLVSGHLFKPFRKTLERIRNFQLQEKRHLPAAKTNVKEFDDLNRFVEEMTSKAVTDYRNLKEFAENASHELQTPLAIAKGKLELLTESGLTPNQYTYVESLQRTIRKLSRLSESLALLTKIENHEFKNGENVNLSQLVREGIHSFEEFISLNHLHVEMAIADDVQVQMHPVLADIMWMNLFQNSIRHNVKDGEINVQLTDSMLSLSNTGPEPTVPTAELFERFRKADQNSNSIGLGLSIVRHIADQNGFELSYTFEDGWHNIHVLLNGVKS